MMMTMTMMKETETCFCLDICNGRRWVLRGKRFIAWILDQGYTGNLKIVTSRNYQYATTIENVV
jgi:hypothetical protein